MVLVFLVLLLQLGCHDQKKETTVSTSSHEKNTTKKDEVDLKKSNEVANNLNENLIQNTKEDSSSSTVASDLEALQGKFQPELDDCTRIENSITDNAQRVKTNFMAKGLDNALKKYLESPQKKPIIANVMLTKYGRDKIATYPSEARDGRDDSDMGILCQWISLSPDVNGFILINGDIEKKYSFRISDLEQNCEEAKKWVMLGAQTWNIGDSDFGKDKMISQCSRIGFVLTVDGEKVSDCIYVYPTTYDHTPETFYMMYPWPGKKYSPGTSEIQSPPDLDSI